LFVEALGYGTFAMPASVLFSCYQALFFSLVHHFLANEFVQLVEVSFKQ